jgi:sarcosine oxidase
MARWPQWQLRADDRALYQAEGGLVDARRSIATHAALARAHGATILDNTRVLALTPTPDGVTVETSAGVFQARRVVVAADAWTNQVLAGVGAQFPLTVTQEQVTYFATSNLREFAPDRFPIWIWHGGDDGSGWFYGFPVYGEVATKAGEDVGGDVVTAETRTFEPNPRPFERLSAFLSERCPGFLGPVMYTKTCLYTMTPDRNFIIEQLPECPQVSVAVGAAHAFKFSSLIGQILTDLAVEGDTRYPIAPFASTRRALTDPDFAPAFSLSPAAAS